VLEAITRKVTKLEATYFPGAVTFTMDVGNTTRSVGTWLKWQNTNQENNKAVYSTLMVTMLSGKRIKY